MKNIKMRVITWIGLLAVCLLPIGARAAEHYQSGIYGLVDATNWSVEVCSESGKVIAYVPTDGDGFFVVDLKPGNYVLTPFDIYIPVVGPGQATPNFVSVINGPSKTVKVVRNRFTFVKLPVEVPFPFTGAPFLHGPLPVPTH
jgi:hypothetical protein